MDGLDPSQSTGESRSGAGRRRGPNPESGEGFDGFLLSPATQSEVSGLGQNSPVVLFLLISDELEWQTEWLRAFPVSPKVPIGTSLLTVPN